MAMSTALLQVVVKLFHDGSWSTPNSNRSETVIDLYIWRWWWWWWQTNMNKHRMIQPVVLDTKFFFSHNSVLKNKDERAQSKLEGFESDSSDNTFCRYRNNCSWPCDLFCCSGVVRCPDRSCKPSDWSSILKPERQANIQWNGKTRLETRPIRTWTCIFKRFDWWDVDPQKCRCRLELRNVSLLKNGHPQNTNAFQSPSAHLASKGWARLHL